MEQTVTSLGSAIAGVDFSPIYDTFVELIPTLIPVAITFIGLRKGIAFLMSTLNNA